MKAIIVQLFPEQIKIRGFTPPAGRDKVRVIPNSHYAWNQTFKVVLDFGNSTRGVIPLVQEGEEIIINLPRTTTITTMKVFRNFPVNGEIRSCKPDTVYLLVFPIAEKGS